MSRSELTIEDMLTVDNKPGEDADHQISCREPDCDEPGYVYARIVMDEDVDGATTHRSNQVLCEDCLKTHRESDRFQVAIKDRETRTVRGANSTQTLDGIGYHTDKREVASESETEVGHCKADPTDVYVGRGQNGRDMLSVAKPGKRGWLGNPFALDDGYSRAESIDAFRTAFEDKLERDSEFREAVAGLQGQTLGCWCQHVDEDDPACHGEVIAEWADRLASEVAE